MGGMARIRAGGGAGAGRETVLKAGGGNYRLRRANFYPISLQRLILSSNLPSSQ